MARSWTGTDRKVEMHQRNTRAIKMHFQGAVAVLQKNGSPYKMARLAQKIVASFACWTSFAPPNTLLIPFAELIWSPSIYASGERKDPNVVELVNDSHSSIISEHLPLPTIRMQKTYDNDYTSPELHFISETLSGRPCPPREPPRYSRNLSPPLLKATQRVTGLSFLARRARDSPITLQEQAELLAGICCGGQELASLNPRTLSPLEDCIRMTTLIHFFADVVPFEEEDESRITHLTESVERRISSIDLELLLDNWPEVGLWMAIVVGVFAKAETWTFFQDLLRLFCGRLKLLKWDAVIDIVDQFQPISSKPFLRCCKVLWVSSMALKSVQIGLGQMRRHTVLGSEIT